MSNCTLFLLPEVLLSINGRLPGSIKKTGRGTSAVVPLPVCAFFSCHVSGIISFLHTIDVKRKRQCSYKPGSVPSGSSICVPHQSVSVIYLLCMSPYSSSVLPSASDGLSSGGSLHELAVPKTYSRHVTMMLVGSYPTFSPLHRRVGAVIFFYVT